MMQSLGFLFGSTITVETKHSVFEGVFRAISPKNEFVVDMVHKVNQNSPAKIDVNTIEKRYIFDVSDIIRCTFYDVNIENAETRFKKCIQMTEVVGNGVEASGMRRLEEWTPEDGEDVRMEHLETGGGSNRRSGEHSLGWSATDMFAQNEEKHGVQSTFDPDLRGYTVALDRSSTFFKDNEAKAEMVAREIDSKFESEALRPELENGECEEVAFSAVKLPSTSEMGRRHQTNRPSDDNRGSGRHDDIDNAMYGGNAGRYMAPGRRHNIGGGRGYSRSGHNREGEFSSGRNRGRHYDRGNADERYHHHSNHNDDRRGGGYGAGQRDFHGIGVADSISRSNGSNQPRHFSGYNRRDNQTSRGDGSPHSGSGNNISSFDTKPEVYNHPPTDVRLLPAPELASSSKPSSPPLGAPTTSADTYSKPPMVVETSAVQEAAIEAVLESHTTKIASDKVVKSSLNPNAKEFVLNPTAKSFTPLHMLTSSFQPGPAMIPSNVPPMSMAMPTVAMPGHQLQYIHGAQGMIPHQMMPQVNTGNIPHQSPRFKQQTRNDYAAGMTHRATGDLSSPIHVAAATGQPLMTPVPPNQQYAVAAHMQQYNQQLAAAMSGPPNLVQQHNMMMRMVAGGANPALLGFPTEAAPFWAGPAQPANGGHTLPMSSTPPTPHNVQTPSPGPVQPPMFYAHPGMMVPGTGQPPPVNGQFNPNVHPYCAPSGGLYVLNAPQGNPAHLMNQQFVSGQLALNNGGAIPQYVQQQVAGQPPPQAVMLGPSAHVVPPQ